jgi:hypothetical protein
MGLNGVGKLVQRGKNMRHFATMHSCLTFHAFQYEGDEVYEVNHFSRARSKGRRKRSKRTREINDEQFFFTA